MTATKQPTAQAVLDYIREHPEATAEQVATGMGIGRSSVRKHLAALIRAGKVERKAGGHQGRRRLPDRFMEPSAGKERAPQHEEQVEPRKGSDTKRLRPGELDGLVLAHMREREDDLPLTASAIGKGIERSSGAVANCLARLAKAGRVRLAKKRPRRYAIKKASTG